MAQLKIDLVVDNKGSVQIQRFAVDAEKGISSIGGRVDGLNKQFLTLGGGIKTAFAGLGGAYALRELASIADTYTLLAGRLRLVTDSERELRQTEAELYQMAQQTRGSYESTVDLYTRFARATEGVKIAQTDLLSITKGINQAIIVSGAGYASADAAMAQLGQGLASGTLRGEELNSVLEQTPRVAKMIADGLGVSIGALREYGKEGMLTSNVVLQALLSQSGAVNAEFERMQTTVGQAGTVLENTLKSLVHDADQGAGATQSIATSIVDLSKTIDENRGEILSLFGGIVTAADFAADRVGNIVRAVKGASAVAAGALDLKYFAVMNPDELKTWVKDFDNGTAGIKKQLADARKELSGLNDSDLGVAPKMAELNKTVRTLEEQLKAAETAQRRVFIGAKEMAESHEKAATSTFKLSGAKNNASEVSKLHREAIRQTVAETRNLVGAYRDTTKELEEWVRLTGDARTSMQSLAVDYGMADMGEVGRLVAEQNRRFFDGSEVISRFNVALAESGRVVSKARSEYERAQQDLAAMQKELAGNPLLSDAERANKIAPFVDAVKEKSAATSKAVKEQEKLNELNDKGALTEDALKRSIFGTAEARRQLAEATIADLEASGDYFDNIQAGLMRVAGESDNAGRQISYSIQRGFDNAADAIAAFVTGSKVEVGDLVRTIAADFARLATQQYITGPLASGLGSLFSGLFSGGGASAAASSGGAWANEAIVAGWFHGGGVVGQDAPALSRTVPQAVFARAPRFHGGFMADEYPAVLQRGESVLTAKQMAALGGMGGKGKGANIQVHNYGRSTIEVEEIGPNEIRIIAREESSRAVRRQAPGIIAASVNDPNSVVSKALGRSTTTSRRR